MKNLKTMALIAIVILAISCKKEKAATIDTRPVDIDGNVYDTVRIGSQTWMVQNLRTTRYNDGTPITTNLDDPAWSTNTIGAYTIYDNDTANNTLYGKLYNWFAVNTGKLAPAGWHVPTNTEWNSLRIFLGTDGGNKMKATTLWTAEPSITNSNSSGFTALPAGYRYPNGAFLWLGGQGYFWSSNVTSGGYPYKIQLSYNSSDINIGTTISNTKREGFSVRCIRN